MFHILCVCTLNRAGVLGLLIVLSAGKELPKPNYYYTTKSLAPLLVFYVRRESAYGLLQMQGVKVDMGLNLRNVTRVSCNVLVETKSGDSQSVVMLGGHLDSHFTSPGVNDNGSTVALLVEMAVQCAEKKIFSKVKNKVRFAFWGLMKYGLLGSQHYVEVKLLQKKASLWLGVYFLLPFCLLFRVSTKPRGTRLLPTWTGT